MTNSLLDSPEVYCDECGKGITDANMSGVLHIFYAGTLGITLCPTCSRKTPFSKRKLVSSIRSLGIALTCFDFNVVRVEADKHVQSGLITE